MVKQFLALAFAAIFINFYSPLPVSAEQAAAETYRQIINSGQFYLEYSLSNGFSKRKINFGTIGIAVSGNQKMIYSAIHAGMTPESYIPIVGGFLGGNKIKLTPNIYYDGENYYDIRQKKIIIKSTPAQLQDKYINPEDGRIKEKFQNAINISEDFGMFTGNAQVSFVESGQRAVDEKGKKIMTYDKYVKTLLNVDGKISNYKTFFYVYYDDKGEIAGIDRLTVEGDVDTDKELNGTKYQVFHIAINKLTADLPENAFKFPEESRIYEPWLGDMNELVEQRVSAES